MPSGDIELQSKTIIPPVMGWNTKDALSAMGPEYAVEMENFFPGFGSVDLVNGYRYHSKGIGAGGAANVQMIAELYTGATRKLVAGGENGHVYDATTAGVAATDLGGGATADPFLYSAQYKGRIFLAQGTGDVYSWDGAAGAIVSSGFGMPAAGTRAMAVYKSRLYGAVGSGATVWYTDLNAYTLDDQFDFASILKYGGNITFIGSVTRAKDFSEDELFCAITDQGEILVYRGDYPGEVSTWGIIGHYFIPRPLGVKSFFYIGANLCVLTSQGLIPMSEVMGGTATGKYLTLSDNVTSAFTSAATTTLLNNNAWCGVNYPRGNFAVCNIPVTSGSVSSQYYMNTTTQAWCKRTNQNAFCWCIFNDELYFGGLNGKVFKADNGNWDEDPGTEGAILTRTIKLRPAYNYFGDTESYKQFTFCIPTVYQSNTLALTIDANVDYANTVATSPNVDTTKGNSYQIYQPRCGLKGIGKAASIRIDGTVTDKQMSFQALEVFWTPANPA